MYQYLLGTLAHGKHFALISLVNKTFADIKYARNPGVILS